MQSAYTLTTLISNVTELVTAAAGWIGTFVETIIQYPILLIGVIISLVGLGIGLIKRLMRV